jgi:hypothetical protein
MDKSSLDLIRAIKKLSSGIGPDIWQAALRNQHTAVIKDIFAIGLFFVVLILSIMAMRFCIKDSWKQNHDLSDVFFSDSDFRSICVGFSVVFVFISIVVILSCSFAIIDKSVNPEWGAINDIQYQFEEDS